jgi:hypothetical protein
MDMRSMFTAPLYAGEGVTASGALEILKECGADGWVKRYEEELANI